MKSLHKKISAVALIAVLGAPVLSQGLVISSSSSSSSSNNKGVVVSYDELQNRIFMERYEEQYKYYSVYLKSPEKEDLNYSDRWKFLNGLKKGDLDKYRKEKESIVIKIGNSYFRIYLLMPQHQRDRIIVKECAKKYNFDIILLSRSNSAGLAEMNAKILNKFKGNPKLIEELLKEPNKKWVNVFPDGESFRYYLQLGKIDLEKGYSRYRIGDSDYIFYKSYSSSLPSYNKIVLPLSEFQNYMEVKKYQEDYYYDNYDALYLGSEKELSGKYKADKSYSDRWAFVKGLKRADLRIYRRREKPIIVKVGKSYFKFFFDLSDFQRQSIFIKELGKKYGFNVEYGHRNDYYGGVHEMDSYIMNRFKDNPELMNKLLKRPSKYGKDVFEDAQHFASWLDLGRISIPKGYSRYVIGDYDYLFSKK